MSAPDPQMESPRSTDDRLSKLERDLQYLIWALIGYVVVFTFLIAVFDL